MNPKLAQGLSNLRRRLLAIGFGVGLGWGLAAAVALLIAWMWLDLVLDFHSTLRAAASWLSLLAGLALIALAVGAAMLAATPHALANRLDQTANTRGQILAGVDLAEQTQSDPLSQGLATIAVDRAGALAAQIPAAKAVPANTLRWPFAGAGALLACVGIVALAAPNLAGTQWARFTDPFGDHPPYSRVKLKVEPGDQKIVYGQGFDIRVTTEGGLVEKAEVVLTTENGQEDVLPMFGEGENKWRATVANLTAAGKYHVRAPGSRSQKYNITLITVPKLEGVRVRVTPPAYTNRPPYEGQVPQGGLSGLAGTKVELFAKSNRPLSGGTIDLDGSPSSVRMTASVNEATGMIILDKPGKLTLRVIDEAGQPSTDTFSAPITLLQDERPFVRLVQPLANSFATPSTNLPIEVIAEDDYGLSRVQVFRSLNDSRALPMDIPVPKPAATRLPVTTFLKLSQFGLKPGDSIKVYARVEDNDPAGAKGSESNIAVVKIISDSDYKRMLIAREGMEVLQSKYAQAQRRMEAMAEEVRKLEEELAKKEGVDDETRKKLEELAEKLAKEAAEVKKAAEEDLPFDIDKQLNKELEKVAKELEEAAKQAKELAKNGQSIPKITGALEELAKRLGGAQQEFKQEATEPLEHLAKIFPLIEDEARFLLIHEQQKELFERLASMKDKEHTDDPKEKVRMRDMEEEQRKLREELRLVLDDIEQHLLELPDDEKLEKMRETAADFAKSVRESAANDRMQDAEQGLADFNGQKGHGNAKEAWEILDQFVSKCKGMGEGAGQCLVFNPKLAGGLGDSVQQLLDAEGLSTGRGAGGGGGGYMAKRSTLRNVGMYGDMARMAKASKSGGGRADKGVSTDGRGGLDDKGNPMGVDASAKGRSAGEADATVPVNYKRRVGDYFRRVADEIGK